MARKQAQKQLKDPIPTIIGAGITEQWYFKHLQALRGYNVKIKSCYCGRENAFELDKRVDDVLEGQGFAIVVFDADVAQRNDKERQQVQQMKTRYANNKDVLFCDSLPSIEYWFLLHYKDVGRLFNTSNEVKDLCDGKRLCQAIERCKQQEDKVNRGESVSYSKVYKAIELLEKTAKRKFCTLLCE